MSSGSSSNFHGRGSPQTARIGREWKGLGMQPKTPSSMRPPKMEDLPRKLETLKVGEVRRPRCFLDVSINERLDGRVVIELYNVIVPGTAENFRALCSRERGVGPVTCQPLHYRGKEFHAIYEGCSIIGGHFGLLNQDGGEGFRAASGESIYGKFYNDENFQVCHDVPDIVSSFQDVPDHNNSTFTIAFRDQRSFGCYHL